jgi:uncharacterized protein (TIGR03083 family)
VKISNMTHEDPRPGGALAPLDPIRVAHLLRPLDTLLVELLRSLGPAEWEKQTLAPAWKVKDVAAHLLDTPLRKLSICRDGCVPLGPTPDSREALAALVNTLNREGVAVYRRLSPAVLVSLLEWASGESAGYHESLDPSVDAVFSVSWAGEERSPNWFDTARELTERWHHQEQIRLAVGRPGIMTREFYYPVLDCFMRALPYAYRTRDAEPGTLARFDVSGDCGGSWFLYREHDGWRLIRDEAGQERSRTVIPQDIAWRIFTKGIARDAAEAQVMVSGDHALGWHVLDMVAIVA